MKRTLAFLLYLAVATAGSAQTAPGVQKPSVKATPGAAPQAAAANQKPSPAGAGVTVVAVKPAAAPAKGAAVVPVVSARKPLPSVKPGTQVVQVPRSKTPFGKKAQSAAKDSSAQAEESPEPGAEPKAQLAKKIGSAGRRDPFLSPVVNMTAIGSGCSSGKRCLAIEQIALRGIVRSDTGMIAVVVNALDKAYFLRENDPVFNGYVAKITADSIVFRETFRDRLGKSFTRNITKSISRPAA
ncbi:MAG: hypothetical protein JO159_13915 [Acidobacteria bacterium]|nr:hypothetical protein [Acidobacteriota bacterium]MBV9623202.1 hypothetical protein [Acidobacteriota bacterium]